MTVTLNLPPNIEEAFIGEAASRGLTPDEFLSEVLLTRAAWQQGDVSTDKESSSVLLQMEEGVPVLRTGQPMALQVINDTLERVRVTLPEFSPVWRPQVRATGNGGYSR
jgi:hypothetical protein